MHLRLAAHSATDISAANRWKMVPFTAADDQQRNLVTWRRSCGVKRTSSLITPTQRLHPTLSCGEQLPLPEFEAFLRRGLGTFWHQCGTARMGEDETTSVVDGRLRVHGLEALRVADASVLPKATSGNIMASCVVVGELAAKFIKH